MEKLVSKWCDGKTLPLNYVFPPEKRPGKQVFTTCCNTLPVIDLGNLDNNYDQNKIVDQIIEASQQYGFFQVINHGVEKGLIDEARANFKEFFKLIDEENSKYCSNDFSKDKCVLYTGTTLYDKERIHYWRDALRHACTPNLDECVQFWPQNPPTYRKVAKQFVIEVTKLGTRILELISKGLGVENKDNNNSKFGNKVSGRSELLINVYPPCPDPSVTFGAENHFDPNLITLLLQDDHVLGLQVCMDDGQWVTVDPIPYAFVVNMGLAMQVISNGKLKSVEHRVITNVEKTRTSIGLFIFPTMDCYVEPAKELINVDSPQMYKGFIYQDFYKSFQDTHLGLLTHSLGPLQPFLMNHHP